MADNLPQHWRSLTVDDAMAAILDYRGKSPSKSTEGIPLVTAKIVKGGRILEPDEFVPASDYDAWMRRGLPLAGDVVITTEAPLGEVAQLGQQRVALAQRVVALRGKSGILDNRYLKFALQSQFVREQLSARATGTTVQGIRQSELRRVRLPVPPIAEQRAIANVLGALDDKIELNRRTNATLQAMARAVFRSWFVDFDPVVAKAARRTPFGMDAETGALFADALVDSAIGPIPQGWSLSTLGAIAANPRRIVSPSNVDASVAYIGLEHMPRGSIVLEHWGVAGDVQSAKHAFQQGEILFGKLRPYFHKVGVALSNGLCSTDVLVVKEQDSTWFGLLVGHLSSGEFIDYVDAGSGGTKMPRTSWSQMARYRIALPPRPIAQRLTDLYRIAVRAFDAHTSQTRTLVTLRNLLLPKLLSGEIRVREAEDVLEEVGA